jgi:spore germination cell wall hydrolase CwlJ-like protein
VSGGKLLLVLAICGTGALALAQTRSETASPGKVEPAPQSSDWSAWTRPLGPAGPAQPVLRVEEPDPARAAEPEPALDEIDVVDAHWMALTMWGEGRGEGEAGMRAIGHVIRNRWQAKRHGAYVTDTVSAAWQFSAWNQGDPNRARMLDIDGLRFGSRDHQLWLTAKRLATDILAGRSADPTGGALFYHTTGVQPAWSRGVMPVAQVGSHLFFTEAR